MRIHMSLTGLPPGYLEVEAFRDPAGDGLFFVVMTSVANPLLLKKTNNGDWLKLSGAPCPATDLSLICRSIDQINAAALDDQCRGFDELAGYLP